MGELRQDAQPRDLGLRGQPAVGLGDNPQRSPAVSSRQGGVSSQLRQKRCCRMSGLLPDRRFMQRRRNKAPAKRRPSRGGMLVAAVVSGRVRANDQQRSASWRISEAIASSRNSAARRAPGLRRISRPRCKARAAPRSPRSWPRTPTSPPGSNASAKRAGRPPPGPRNTAAAAFRRNRRACCSRR